MVSAAEDWVKANRIAAFAAFVVLAAAALIARCGLLIAYIQQGD